MNRIEKKLFLLFLLTAGLSSQSSAQIAFNEKGDAAFTRENAQAVTTLGTTQIVGTLGSNSDCDVYKIAFNSDVLLDIETVSSLDLCLLLFNRNGRGLEGDDDHGLDGNGFQSRIIRNLSKGVYYLAISSHGNVGLQGFSNRADLLALSNPIIDEDDGALGAPTSQSFFGVRNGGNGFTGAYTIQFFSGATSPVNANPNAKGGLKNSVGTHRNQFSGTTTRRTIKMFFSSTNRSRCGPVRNKFKVPATSKFNTKIFSLTGGRKNVTADLIVAQFDVLSAGLRKKYELKIRKTTIFNAAARARLISGGDQAVGAVRFR